MRLVIRSIGLALLAIVAAVLLALTTTTTSVYGLAAATYILPGLLGYPFTDQASIDLATPYITDITGAGPPAPLNVVFYPTPLPTPDGTQTESVIFGYSAGAMDATTYKQDFNQYWANNAGVPPDVTFVLIGNPGRPNGGTSARAGQAATPTETEGAAPGQITTYDIVRQYDGVGDYPTNPGDLLADANAAMGFLLVHLDYSSVDMSEAQLQGTYGDTAYYLIPTYPLPLLMPLDVIPGVGPILADTLDPALRVLVEAGYDRTINPGVPTPSNSSYSPDPTALANNFQLAVLTGLDNGLEDLGQGRPLGTVRPGPYGVGGPPVTAAPITLAPTQSAAAPLQLVNNSGGSVVDTSAAAQQAAPISADTVSGGEKVQPSIRRPMASNPLAPKLIRPSADGVAETALDGSTSGPPPRPGSASSSAATSSGGVGQHARHARGTG